MPAYAPALFEENLCRFCFSGGKRCCRCGASKCKWGPTSLVIGGAKEMQDSQILKSRDGVVIFDPSQAGDFDDHWFDRSFWLTNGTAMDTPTGRGSVLVLDMGAEAWVLRHYFRGGFIARFLHDQYFWLGVEQSRAFREWRLLYRLHAAGLPVPKPIAGRVRRHGLIYRADIITAYIPETRTLSAWLRDGGLDPGLWRTIGEMLREFHAFGVDHPDLTAHNILIGTHGEVFLVDFDNASLQEHGPWQEMGLARFQRSLRKVAMETGTLFDQEAWQELERAYRAVPGH